MPFLNLNKLLPPRKAWKVFTKKVQSKLNKLNRSEAIKRPKNRFNKPPKRISWPNLCVQGKRFKPKKKPAKRILYPSQHLFQRKPSAVYIDQLFIEPVVPVIQEHPLLTEKPAAVSRTEAPSSSSQNKVGIMQVSTGEEDSADDMWESLVLASPQMNGINERAEEFITRFRAEMLLQERLARRL